MNSKTLMYSVRDYYVNEPKSDTEMGQFASKIWLAKFLGDPPNWLDVTPSYWLFLGWLDVSFGSLGFKGLYVKYNPCSPNRQPFSVTLWIIQQS